MDRLAGEGVEALAVAGQHPVRAPLPDRDDGSTGLQRDPRRTGLAAHRPHVGVTRQRPLGEHRDQLPRADRRHRRAEGLGGITGVAVHGDLLRAA